MSEDGVVEPESPLIVILGDVFTPGEVIHCVKIGTLIESVMVRVFDAQGRWVD